MGKSKAAAASSSRSSSSSSKNVEEAAELQDLGALAQQMEEQLMQEFEALLASRRKEQPSLLGAKPSSSSSLSRKADGQQQLQQEARDAVYWRSMYERLRDLRETEAERMLAEVTRHAEERERALTELVAHLEEENAGTGTSSKGAFSSSSRHRRDVRLSDVSVAGAAPAPMDMAVDDEEEDAGGKGKKKGSEEADKAAVLAGRVATLEGKVTALKRVLMAYQRLTSLCISLEEGPSDVAGKSKSKGNGKSGGGRVSTLRCTAVSHVHKKALEFQLKMNCDEEDNYKQDAIFKPLRDRKSLPACMQEEVAIETQQCPILLRTILGTLFSTSSSSSKKTKE